MTSASLAGLDGPEQEGKDCHGDDAQHHEQHLGEQLAQAAAAERRPLEHLGVVDMFMVMVVAMMVMAVVV